MPRRSSTATVCTRPLTPTTGCRWACAAGSGPGGVKTGLQIDCMVCHGGSIGGQSYVGLGNTQLDLKAVLFELTIADGKRPPFSTFVLNSSRGTNNAGQIAAVLLSLRNPDLSVRSFPLPLGVNLPEMDTPAWWHLKRKRTMYYDGRTDARSVRTNMQFLLGEKSLEDLKALEPAFRDVQAFLQSLEPPKYPFPIDAAKAARGAGRLRVDLRPLPRHLRTGRQVSQQDRPAGRDRHRPGPVAGALRPPGRPLQHDLAGGRAARSTPSASATRPRRSTASGPPPPTCTTARCRPCTPCSSRRAAPRGSPAPRRPTSRTTTPTTSAGSSPRSAPRSWPRRPGARRFRPSSSSTPPGSEWATAAIPSAIELSEDERMDLIEYLKTL